MHDIASYDMLIDTGDFRCLKGNRKGCKTIVILKLQKDYMGQRYWKEMYRSDNSDAVLIIDLIESIISMWNQDYIYLESGT